MVEKSEKGKLRIFFKIKQNSGTWLLLKYWLQEIFMYIKNFLTQFKK